MGRGGKLHRLELLLHGVHGAREREAELALQCGESDSRFAMRPVRGAHGGGSLPGDAARPVVGSAVCGREGVLPADRREGRPPG
jgi:hypothetical protein